MHRIFLLLRKVKMKGNLLSLFCTARTCIVLTLLAIIVFAPTAFATPLVDIQFPSTNLGTPTNLPDYIRTFYEFALGIAGFLAFIMILVGGAHILFSAGADKVKEGKEYITSALYGVALLFGSYLILNTVNPNLINVSEPGSVQKIVQKCPPGTTLKEENGKITCTESETCSGDYSSISVLTAGNDASFNCKKRKVVTNSELIIIDNTDLTDDYYNEKETIPAGSAVWLYPYFVASSTGSRCLIYAFQKPGAMSPTMIDLNNEGKLRLCPFRKGAQDMSDPTEAEDNSRQCTSWNLIATNDVGGEEVTLGARKVDPGWVYYNISNPPGITEDDTRTITIPANRTVKRWECGAFSYLNENSNEICKTNESIPAGALSEDQAAQELISAEIFVQATKVDCNDRCDKNCTSLKGMPSNVVTKLVELKNACVINNNKCNFKVSGGTEVGHKTHGLGKPAVDLINAGEMATGDFYKYVKDNASALGIKKICTTPQYDSYRIGCDNYDEVQEHIHLEF